jgi:hypothetical protein
LETLLVYYSSFGIKESPPLEDPESGNYPVGALAIATTAVCHPKFSFSESSSP